MTYEILHNLPLSPLTRTSSSTTLLGHSTLVPCKVQAMGGEFGEEWIHVSVWLNPFAVHLKLSQHCYSAISQYKIKIFKNKIKKLKKRFRQTDPLFLLFPWLEILPLNICTAHYCIPFMSLLKVTSTKPPMKALFKIVPQSSILYLPFFLCISSWFLLHPEILWHYIRYIYLFLPYWLCQSLWLCGSQ